MKKILVLIVSSMLYGLSACETILPVDMPEGEEWGITLNAVASPDTTFRAYVTQCYPNSEATEYMYPTIADGNGYFDRYPYSHYYAGYIHDWERWGNDQIIKEAVLADAEVKLIVNQETTYSMQYDAEQLCFLSDYTPAIGDHLEVRISNAASGEETVAHAEVPRPQKLEILDSKKLKKEAENAGKYIEHVQMKLRIHDPAEEKNYYRLKVRRIDYNYDSLYFLRDTYQSSDPIFKDDRLTTAWGSWEAYFSDVFDDRLINGQAYEFYIETNTELSIYKEWKPIFEISLQSITEDYYHYLKSLQLYRISTLSTYSEGVYIHSNNEGGWGMLGAISGEVHRVELTE